MCYLISFVTVERSCVKFTYNKNITRNMLIVAKSFRQSLWEIGQKMIVDRIQIFLPNGRLPSLLPFFSDASPHFVGSPQFARFHLAAFWFTIICPSASTSLWMLSPHLNDPIVFLFEQRLQQKMKKLEWRIFYLLWPNNQHGLRAVATDWLSTWSLGRLSVVKDAIVHCAGSHGLANRHWSLHFDNCILEHLHS